MKIDTGADVTAIPEQLYQQRPGQRYALQISDRILRGLDGNRLLVSGCIKVPLWCTVPDALLPNHTVYVVRGLQAPLLGRPAIQGLRILGQVNHISERRIDIKNAQTSFPSLFSGLEKFKGLPHNISLREDAIPYSLATLRRVPFPPMPRVEAALQRIV